MMEWQPFRERVRDTLVRNVGIAVVVGGVLALTRFGITRWPALSAVMLWPTLGGHALEVWFLNWLRPRLPGRRAVQVSARIAGWFVGGTGLVAAMWLTAAALPGLRPPPAPAWWLAGLAFVGVELVAHLGSRLRKRPSFFDGYG